MMLVLSLCYLGIVAISIYLGTRIQDEVFKVGMALTAIAFSLVILICAPWILKVIVASIPLAISTSGNLFVKNIPF